jgi:hypothetical protein
MRDDNNDGEPSLDHTVLPVGAEGRSPYAMQEAALSLFKTREICITSSWAGCGYSIVAVCAIQLSGDGVFHPGGTQDIRCI